MAKLTKDKLTVKVENPVLIAAYKKAGWTEAGEKAADKPDEKK